MANWKKLTEFDGLEMHVNLDNAAFMFPSKDQTAKTTKIYFVGASRETGLTVEVIETLEEIHKAPTIGVPQAKWKNSSRAE